MLNKFFYYTLRLLQKDRTKFCLIVGYRITLEENGDYRVKGQTHGKMLWKFDTNIQHILPTEKTYWISCREGQEMRNRIEKL